VFPRLDRNRSREENSIDCTGTNPDGMHFPVKLFLSVGVFAAERCEQSHSTLSPAGVAEWIANDDGLILWNLCSGCAALTIRRSAAQ
jgi:hypothetical protein